MAVAVPDVDAGEIALTHLQCHAPLIVGIADTKIEGAAHDDAELFIGFVVVQYRATGAPGDPPEPQLQMFTENDAPTKARSAGVDELILVEEEAVLLEARRSMCCLHVVGP